MIGGSKRASCECKGGITTFASSFLVWNQMEILIWQLSFSPPLDGEGWKLGTTFQIATNKTWIWHLELTWKDNYEWVFSK